jgi:hypothetical protein
MIVSPHYVVLVSVWFPSHRKAVAIPVGEQLNLLQYVSQSP